MLRVFGAVIVGYIVMFIVVFGSFTAAYLAMGADRAFLPGSYEVTALWLGVSFLLAFVAALAGGFVCAAISQGGKAPMVLAGLVLVLGLLMAVSVVAKKAEPKVREGAAGNLEAMQNAYQPPWVALLTPFVGAVGVLAGAKLKRQ
ncbi:MAG: hypothetical protein ACR2L2_18395 [Acidobacteriota bacterium]